MFITLVVCRHLHLFSSLSSVHLPCTSTLCFICPSFRAADFTFNSQLQVTGLPPSCCCHLPSTPTPRHTAPPSFIPSFLPQGYPLPFLLPLPTPLVRRVSYAHPRRHLLIHNTQYPTSTSIVSVHPVPSNSPHSFVCHTFAGISFGEMTYVPRPDFMTCLSHSHSMPIPPRLYGSW